METLRAHVLLTRRLHLLDAMVRHSWKARGWLKCTDPTNYIRNYLLLKGELVRGSSVSRRVDRTLEGRRVVVRA